MAAAGPASKSLSQQYSVPGREGWKTNETISRTFHNGGNSPPLLAVVTLPAAASVDSPTVQAGLADLQTRVERALPGSRATSYATTRDRAFVSGDGHCSAAWARWSC